MITAVHGDYGDLFAKSFSCTIENYTDISTANNLSVINACYTTLNNK